MRMSSSKIRFVAQHSVVIYFSDWHLRFSPTLCLNYDWDSLLFGSQRRRSLSLPVLTLIFPALLPCLMRDSLCTALQTKILWINWSLKAIDTIRNWVRGTWLPWRDVRSRLYDGAWERWRIVCLVALSVEDIDIYLFGTMITGILLIGLGSALGYRKFRKREQLSKAPQGCPYDWSCGKSGQHWDWDYNRHMDSTKEKFTALQREINSNGDQNGQNGQSSLQKFECLLAPKTKQSYLFLAPLQWPWQGCCWNLPRSAIQWDALAFLPHPTDITDIAPPPPTIRLCSLRSAGLVKRVWPAPDQWLRDQMAACWAGFTSPVACRVCAFVLLRCFPVLTLYSPRSIVWGLFFSPHFPHVNAVFFFNSTCISLLIILVWLCMWRIIKNLEPWLLITNF